MKLLFVTLEIYQNNLITLYDLTVQSISVLFLTSDCVIFKHA